MSKSQHDLKDEKHTYLSTPRLQDESKASQSSNQSKTDPPRKGANGVVLKKFEAVMSDMFSTPNALAALTPKYARLPPGMNDAKKRELVQFARCYWERIGLPKANGNIVEESEGNGGGTTANDIIESSTRRSPWPFDDMTQLPTCGSVRGEKGGIVGDVTNYERAWRKESQLANLIQCVLAMLPDHARDFVRLQTELDAIDEGKDGMTPILRIVDFGGGTGHLTVPLALLLPHCEVVCVDLKKRSLDLLHRRVDCMILGDNAISDDYEIDKWGNAKLKSNQYDDKFPCQSNTVQRSRTLPNLYTYHGTIQNYPKRFEIGVSLHACGEASDWTLRKCLDQKSSWVVCGCCCGKLRRDAGNPYVYQSTGGNEKEVSYPQSRVFACLGGKYNNQNIEEKGNHQIMTADMFDELARASDYSELGDVRKPRNACRRAAKSLVEWDRLLFTKQCLECSISVDGTSSRGSNTVLTRMNPWEASPKNDILLGWFDSSSNPYRIPDADGLNPDMLEPLEDPTCHVDFEVALQHLFGNNCSGTALRESTHPPSPSENKKYDQNDWTAQEEADIQNELEQYIYILSCDLDDMRSESGSVHYEVKDIDSKGVLRFPKKMGSRKRKLIHFVAERMGLRHWGEGKKDRDKLVAVALRSTK
mmetsp:Transcript_9729/g.19151  ORF Transcript_9729/g.19151 Transcript_9729/m.19151 type:complete len:646 (+) Transcript_9729:397-2334(+)